MMPRISLMKHPDVWICPALVDYDSDTIYLGNEVHPDDVEELIEDILTHEYTHYVLYTLFDIETAKKYDKIYGHVEPKGRVITIAIG